MARAKPKPGPVNILPIPFTKPLANVEPIPSPSKTSLILLTTVVKPSTIPFAASKNPILPSVEANC